MNQVYTQAYIMDSISFNLKTLNFPSKTWRVMALDFRKLAHYLHVNSLTDSSKIYAQVVYQLYLFCL